MSLIDLTKELNDINDTRKENNLQEQYDAALEKVKRLDQAIADAMKFGDRTAMAGLSLSYKNAEAELDEYRKQLYELKETQKAAEWDAAPCGGQDCHIAGQYRRAESPKRRNRPFN